MCNGWAMIPLAVAIKSKEKLVVPMMGGSPFMEVKINEQKRKGTVEAIKRAVGMKVKSQLEIVMYTTSKRLQPLQPVSYILPNNIILPISAVPMAIIYRSLLNEARTKLPIYRSMDRVLPQSGSHFVSDIILSTFPRIVSDEACLRVLLHLWTLEAPNDAIIIKTIADMVKKKLERASLAGNDMKESYSFDERSSMLLENIIIPARHAYLKADNPKLAQKLGSSLSLNSSQMLLDSTANPVSAANMNDFHHAEIPTRAVDTFKRIVLKILRAYGSVDTQKNPLNPNEESVEETFRRYYHCAHYI
jgi:hypothetical protein